MKHCHIRAKSGGRGYIHGGLWLRGVIVLILLVLTQIWVEEGSCHENNLATD